MYYIDEAGPITLSTLIGLAKGAENTFSANAKKQKTRELGKSGKNGSVGQSGGLYSTSIMKASKDLIMSFPVLCSDRISGSTAMTISKAIERNCVTTLQLLFASAYMTGDNGKEIINRWHTNIDTNMAVDDYLNLLDNIAKTADSTITAAKESLIQKDLGRQFLIECTKMYETNESFNESSLNDYSVEQDSCGRTYLRESKHKTNKKYTNGDEKYKYQNDKNILTDPSYTGVNTTVNGKDAYRGLDKDEMEVLKFEEEKRKNSAAIANAKDRLQQQKSQADASARAEYEKDLRNRLQRQKELEKNIEQKKQELDQKKKEFEYKQQIDQANANKERVRNQIEFYSKQLVSSDVKKVNELVPSMIQIKYYADQGENKQTIENVFIAGVKARLVPCAEEDINDAITSVNRNKVSLVNLIRATTNEIKFGKDFIMAIDQAKIDAQKNTTMAKSSAIWRSLQARSTKSGLRRLSAKRSNDAGAITTLVVSKEQVNGLKISDDIDLEVPKNVIALMDIYNFMCFVIVDEQNEVARFFMDGEGEFADYTFSSLERENADTTTKKVINLMNRNNL